LVFPFVYIRHTAKRQRAIQDIVPNTMLATVHVGFRDNTIMRVKKDIFVDKATTEHCLVQIKSRTKQFRQHFEGHERGNDMHEMEMETEEDEMTVLEE